MTSTFHVESLFNWAVAYAAAGSAAHSFASSSAKLLYVLGWCPSKAAKRAVWSSVLLNPAP